MALACLLGKDPLPALPARGLRPGRRAQPGRGRPGKVGLRGRLSPATESLMARHGTVTRYNAGCHCGTCKSAIAEYRRLRRARARTTTTSSAGTTATEPRTMPSTAGPTRRPPAPAFTERVPGRRSAPQSPPAPPPRSRPARPQPSPVYATDPRRQSPQRITATTTAPDLWSARRPPAATSPPHVASPRRQSPQRTTTTTKPRSAPTATGPADPRHAWITRHAEALSATRRADGRQGREPIRYAIEDPLASLRRR